MQRLDAGDLIQGTGGLRKIRWAAKGRGKRGGVSPRRAYKRSAIRRMENH